MKIFLLFAQFVNLLVTWWSIVKLFVQKVYSSKQAAPKAGEIFSIVYLNNASEGLLLDRVETLFDMEYDVILDSVSGRGRLFLDLWSSHLRLIIERVLFLRFFLIRWVQWLTRFMWQRKLIA